MINVNQEWKDNVYKGTEKQILISAGGVTLTDDDIQGDLEIQETLTNSKDIKIGSCVASSLKFNLSNKGQSVDFLNNDISIQVGIKIPSTGEFELVPLGVFSIDKIDDKDERVFKITARDRMKLFDKDSTEFLATRVYPITLWNLTTQLCNYVGIELENTSILNGDYLIDENFKAMDFTCQQLLSWIGEVAASFINVNRYGKLVFKTFTTVENTLTDRDYININVEKYEVPQITRLQVAVQEDDLGVIVGGGNITYAIINNPLLYTKSEEQISGVMDNILNRLQNIPVYHPVRVYGKGDPSIETGDIFKVTTVKGQEVNVLMMDRKFVYRKSFRDTYESFGTASVGEKRIVQHSLLQTKGKMNILTRNLEQNLLKVADLEIGYNEINQTVDQLSIEVSQLELEGVATFYQNEIPETPDKGDIWFNPGINYTVDNLTMLVNDMTMTVNELIFTPSKLSRWNGEEWDLIEDTELLRDVANFGIRADEIEGKVESAEGNIGELQLTATSLEGKITSTQGDIGELKLTSIALSSRMVTAEGKIGELEFTADAFELRFNDITVLNETIEGGVTRISRDGIVVTNNSGSSRLEMLSTTGFALYSNTGSGIEKKFYVNTDGTLQAKNLIIDENSKFLGRIDVGTDAIIGNNLILGMQSSGSGQKGVSFWNNSYISANYSKMIIRSSNELEIKNNNMYINTSNTFRIGDGTSGSPNRIILGCSHVGGTLKLQYGNSDRITLDNQGINFHGATIRNLERVQSVQDKYSTSIGIEFRVYSNKLQYKRTNTSVWSDIV